MNKDFQIKKRNWAHLASRWLALLPCKPFEIKKNGLLLKSKHGEMFMSYDNHHFHENVRNFLTSNYRKESAEVRLLE